MHSLNQFVRAFSLPAQQIFRDLLVDYKDYVFDVKIAVFNYFMYKIAVDNHFFVKKHYLFQKK